MKLTARQAPRRGGRSAVIAHPDSVRSASRRSAGPWALMSQTKPPAPRRFRGRAPAARNPCWSHCPFPGLIGTITPALRGGTSRAAPHVRGTDRRVARPPTSGAGLGAWLRCPVVNGAGADRYWPVGSGGHGPFVRSHLAVRGHDGIAARRGCLRWDSCCWFARPVSAGIQRGRPGRRTRCGQLAGHAARRPR